MSEEVKPTLKKAWDVISSSAINSFHEDVKKFKHNVEQGDFRTAVQWYAESAVVAQYALEKLDLVTKLVNTEDRTEEEKIKILKDQVHQGIRAQCRWSPSNSSAAGGRLADDARQKGLFEAVQIMERVLVFLDKDQVPVASW